MQGPHTGMFLIQNLSLCHRHTGRFIFVCAIQPSSPYNCSDVSNLGSGTAHKKTGRNPKLPSCVTIPTTYGLPIPASFYTTKQYTVQTLFATTNKSAHFLKKNFNFFFKNGFKKMKSTVNCIYL